MSKETVEYIRDYLRKRWDVDEVLDEHLIDYITDISPISSKCVDTRRWWDEYRIIIKVGDRLIQYRGAKTTGDNSPTDVGWTFDINYICEVEPYEEHIVVTKYREKK